MRAPLAGRLLSPGHSSLFVRIVIEEDHKTSERSVHVDLNKPFDALLDLATVDAERETIDGAQRETARRTDSAGGLPTRTSNGPASGCVSAGARL